MKTIGLIGGMSWESTASYYQLINQEIKQKLGGLHSAKIVLHSLDFAEIEHLQHQGDWTELAQILTDSAQKLESAGADCIAICTNTMHKVAEKVDNATSLPLIHIADTTALELRNNGINHVGLLGTNFTMEQGFYKHRITEQFGIDVLVPDASDRDLVHRVIYQELCQGIVNPTSKTQYLNIIDDLAANGAQAVILGCTEIALLVDQKDTLTPLYNTTAIHAQAIVNYALS